MTHVLRFRYSAQRYGDDAIRAARYWIDEAHQELRRSARPGRAKPVDLCVNRALHAVDALMMALGVTERPTA